MNTRKVTVHKMYEEFHPYPITQYTGEYDDKNNLIRLFNSSKEQLIRVFGTYQWCLPSTSICYFVEEDPFYQRTMD
jgi:hypothetical protein